MNDSRSMNNYILLTSTILVILGLALAYSSQFQPSALLTLIMKDLDINLSLAGFGMSIIYLPIIIFSLFGTYLASRLGLKNLFLIAMLFMSGGILMNFFSFTFPLFLIGRIFYGIGFGLIIPFSGLIIMSWYTPKQREIMNTINALFPFIGASIVYACTLPLYNSLGHSWHRALGIWGLGYLIIILFWLFIVKNSEHVNNSELHYTEKKIYQNLWSRGEIKILSLTFICDFFFYSFIVNILPSFYQLEASTNLAVANKLTMVFPVSGVIGVIISGLIMSKTGRRKKLLWMGQLLKAIGTLMIVIGVTNIIGILGVVLIGLGNSIWIPPLYTIPMELEDMNPHRVGAAFAMITSFGFIAGFISPIVGGWISDLWSIKFTLLLYTVPSVIGLYYCLKIRETGPAEKSEVVYISSIKS
jgi:predicted MFS family arabinose efflux permease